MRGGAFLKGKEGRVGFLKKSFLAGETEGFEKIPSLMGKRDASECNENSLSNCRVQLALSTRKDGMICMQSYFDNHVM